MIKAFSPSQNMLLSLKICCIHLFFMMMVIGNGCERAPQKGWMTYRNDNHLSAESSESIKLPLSLAWVYKPTHAPRTAWYEPSEELPRSHFDNAHYVTIAGKRVFFSSTVDGKVYSLDAETGELLWTYFTEGPVRTVPVLWENKVYAGSDDGYVYCLKARNGKLVWKYRAGPSEKKILGNEHMISPWPVRTSILIDEGIAYFGAGVFPHEGIFICALDADNGNVIWKNDTIGDHSQEMTFGGISPQGYLLCSENILYVPSGRALPAAFDRHTGNFLYFLQPTGKYGGTWALLDRDRLITTTESNATPTKVVYDTKTGKMKPDAYAWYSGIDMIISPDASYIITEDEMISLDWKKLSEAEKKVNENSAKITKMRGLIKDLRTKLSEASSESKTRINEEISQNTDTMNLLNNENNTLRKSVYNWEYPRKGLCSIILAGKEIFAGGDGYVISVGSKTGKEEWGERIEGKVLGLAVHNGCLYVSSDNGNIYCFKEGAAGQLKEIVPILTSFPYSDNKLAAMHASAADEIVRNTGITKGYCLVLGCSDGRLVYELAKRTEMTVIGIEKNIEKAHKAEKILDDTGLLGSRVVVGSWDIANLPDYFANLIVSGESMNLDKSSYPPEEIYRVLRPCGGTVYFGKPSEESGFDPKNEITWMQKAGIDNPEVINKNGTWVKATRGKLKGAGSWTQIYANPENTACSDDMLVKGSLEVLWFGAPGPQGTFDRHAELTSPVSINGRLFVQGFEKDYKEIVSAYDAYNGTLLWQRRIPGAVRVRAKIDGGNLVATEDALYVAAYDLCYRLDQATGQTIRVYEMPASPDGGLRRWGYISCIGNILYGSTAMPLKLQYAQLWDIFTNQGTWKDRNDIPSEYTALYDRYVDRFHDPDIYAWKAFHRDGTFWDRMGSFQQDAVDTIKGAMSDRMRDGNIIFSMKVGDSIFALDTETGKVLWQHKGKEIAHITVSIGDGKIFFAENGISDVQKKNAIAERKKLAKGGIFKEGKDWNDQLKREGVTYEDIDVRMVYALDATTGKKIWSKPVDLTGCCGNMMGSAYHKGMLFFYGHFGNHDAWKFIENQYLWRRITALSADTGDMVWSRSLNYRVKPLIVNDKIIIEPRACDYRTGEIIMRSHPITGQDVEWEFLRPGHCCSLTSASPSMLFYRSHSTGLCDVEGDRGISIFGGIRPGCFINIVPANGLVLFPEASSGCTCSFPVKCSIAFKPCQQKPEWTVFITHGDMTPVKHFSINLGAPADMKDDNGTVWFAYPNPKTVYGSNYFPNYGVKFDLKETIIENMGYFAYDFRDKQYLGTDKPWLFTSGCIGLTRCTIPLIDDTKDTPGNYTVRLGFMAKPDDHEGRRIFDIKLQGTTVMNNFDILKEGGGYDKPVIKEFSGIQVDNNLAIELIPKIESPSQNQAPLINCIEIVREDEITAKTQ